jgi:chromate transporter
MATGGGDMRDRAHEKSRLTGLFFTFLKIGFFTFGGGFAMIPIIEREIVNKRRWIEASEVADIFAVAQTIPGAIAINSSTFVGFKVAGKKGALIATAGVILPSLLIITLIAAFFTRFQDNRMVQDAFLGIRSCIVALIGYAGITMTKSTVQSAFGLLILIIALIAIVAFDVDAVFVIAAGILLGSGLYLTKTIRRLPK